MQPTSTNGDLVRSALRCFLQSRSILGSRVVKGTFGSFGQGLTELYWQRPDTVLSVLCLKWEDHVYLRGRCQGLSDLCPTAFEQPAGAWPEYYLFRYTEIIANIRPDSQVQLVP